MAAKGETGDVVEGQLPDREPLVAKQPSIVERTLSNGGDLVSLLIRDLDGELLWIRGKRRRRKMGQRRNASCKMPTENSPSMAMTTSTASSESSPRSEVKEAVGVICVVQREGGGRISL